MADLTQDFGGGFNPDDHKGEEYAILAKGDYLAIITESEIKATKSGTGKYVEFTLEVISKVGQGRKLWDRINIVNPSETAENIGKATLSSICTALGLRSINDTAELHNRPLVISVSIEDTEFRASGKDNVIKGYRASKNPNETKAAVAPIMEAPRYDPRTGALLVPTVPAQGETVVINKNDVGTITGNPAEVPYPAKQNVQPNIVVDEEELPF